MNPLNLVCMTRRDRCHWIAGLNIRIVRMWSFPVNTGVRRVSLSLWLPQSANIHIQWTSGHWMVLQVHNLINTKQNITGSDCIKSE